MVYTYSKDGSFCKFMSWSRPVKNKAQPNKSKIYEKKTKKETADDTNIKLVPKKLGTVLIKYAETILTFYLWQLYILD